MGLPGVMWPVDLGIPGPGENAWEVSSVPFSETITPDFPLRNSSGASVKTLDDTQMTAALSFAHPSGVVTKSVGKGTLNN